MPLASLIKEEARTERRGIAGGESRISTRDEDAGEVGGSGAGGEAVEEARRERPLLRYGCAAQCKKGEDFFLLRTDCPRPATSASSSASQHPNFAVFAVSTHSDISNLRFRCIHLKSSSLGERDSISTASFCIC